MTTKKKLLKSDPNILAEKLIDVENELLAIEESKRPLVARKEELREEILSSLKTNNLNSIETHQGITFSRAYRASLSISNPDAALKWALAHDCATVDKIRANKALRGGGALPEGFEQTETEYLKADGIKDALNG